MKRRAILAALGGLSTSALAQTSPMRARVAMPTGLAEDDSATKERLAAFREGMATAGWQEGRNLTLDLRFNVTSEDSARQSLIELMPLKPDLLVTQGAPVTAAAQAATKTIPIVFTVLPDPLGAKLVVSLSRPGGNTSGFTSTEPSFGAKWAELLHEIAPSVRRLLVMARQNLAYYQPTIDEAAKRLGLEVAYVQIDKAADITAAIAAARPRETGLVLPTDAFTASNRKSIIDLAIQRQLPLITGNQPFPQDGGLMYYGADIVDLFRRTAAYVDRILRGAPPGELPVQQPTTFRMVINAKTAAALGLDIPSTLRARADEVIE